jgi:hypothetical protein
VLAVSLAGVGPIRDIDAYWHVLLGREILDGVSPALAGRGWSFAPVTDDWVSTQWMGETVSAWLDERFGLRALLLLRAASTLMVLGTLYLVTVRRRPVRAGAWLFVAGALAAGFYSQERPQQVTLILVPVVGWWIDRAWRKAQLPRWWYVMPLVAVWSNFHGGWVLLPLGLGLAALARVLDHGWRDETARGALLLALLAGLSSAVSPLGLGNTFSALRFSSATARIQEWSPLELWDWTSIPLVLVMGIAVVSWARGAVRPTKGELALVLPLLLFATAAWRNMTPIVLLLAPILTGSLARALGLADPPPPTERLSGARATASLAALGICAAFAAALIQAPVIPADVPSTLITRIRDADAPQRILNAYNISGPLLYGAGPPPHITVGIDGRADRYGAEYIDRYEDAMMNGRPGWSDLVDQLAPTAALLKTDRALPELLIGSKRWVEVAREGEWVLLRAPGAAGWGSV